MLMPAAQPAQASTEQGTLMSVQLDDDSALVTLSLLLIELQNSHAIHSRVNVCTVWRAQ